MTTAKKQAKHLPTCADVNACTCGAVKTEQPVGLRKVRALANGSFEVLDKHYIGTGEIVRLDDPTVFTGHKVLCEYGKRYTIRVGASEGNMHMQIAGKRMHMELVGVESGYPMVQFYSEAGVVFSSPVTLGEGGLLSEVDARDMEDEERRAWEMMERYGTDKAEMGEVMFHKEDLYRTYVRFYFQHGSQPGLVSPTKTITITINGSTGVPESAHVQVRSLNGSHNATIGFERLARDPKRTTAMMPEFVHNMLHAHLELPYARRGVFDPHNGESAASFLSGFANIMSDDHKTEAIDLLAREHRTIQQSIAGFCIAYLSKLSENATDPRNEWAVKKAKEAVAAWGGPISIEYVPCI